MVDSYCVGCSHRVQLDPSTSCCNYMIDTGMRRPCASGYGCVCHTNPKSEKKRGRASDWDKALAYKLFKEGKTDKEIATAVGKSKNTVQRWRLKNRLYQGQEMWRKNYRNDER